MWKHCISQGPPTWLSGRSLLKFGPRYLYQGLRPKNDCAQSAGRELELVVGAGFFAAALAGKLEQQTIPATKNVRSNIELRRIRVLIIT